MKKLILAAVLSVPIGVTIPCTGFADTERAQDDAAFHEAQAREAKAKAEKAEYEAREAKARADKAEAEKREREAQAKSEGTTNQ
jgi:hypothetical protein